MIVVSTELAAALYVPGELTETAEAVMRRDPCWASPLIWRALLPMHLAGAIRSGALSAELVGAIVREAPELFRGREFPSPLRDNVDVVLGSDCPPLMAPFVSLARGLGVPLVTTDAAALAALPTITVGAASYATGS